MNALRLIAKNEDGYLHILLPDDIKSKEVEVIILPTETSTDEGIELDNYYGTWKHKKSIEEIDKYIEKTRNEWQRNF